MKAGGVIMYLPPSGSSSFYQPLLTRVTCCDGWSCPLPPLLVLLCQARWVRVATY